MNPEHIKELVTKRMQQATECIEDGRYLLAAGRGTRTAVNRAYYAAFYAVLALLQTLGKAPRKHKGAISLFDTEFIRTDILPKELSMALHQLFDARQEDDYRRFDPIPVEEAKDLLGVAERFVHDVREHLQQSWLRPRNLLTLDEREYSADEFVRDAQARHHHKHRVKELIEAFFPLRLPFTNKA